MGYFHATGILHYWWVYIPATVAVMLFGIAWNLLGDGLSDLLDPAAYYDYPVQPFWNKMFGKIEPTTPVEKVSPRMPGELI